MFEDLGGRGNKRDQMDELFAELLDARIIDQEEKVCLSLLGKTSSVKDEFGRKDGRVRGRIADSQDITLDIVEIQRRGSGGCHVEG